VPKRENKWQQEDAFADTVCAILWSGGSDMTQQERRALLGKTVSVQYFDGLNYYCTVHEEKSTWGHDRFLVRPVAGTGEIWIDAERVEPAKAEKLSNSERTDAPPTIIGPLEANDVS
jgi:hypothetical protein